MDDLSKVEGNLTSSSSANFKEGPLPSLKLVRKQFGGKYAISSEEFTNEMVRILQFLCFDKFSLFPRFFLYLFSSKY